MDTLVPTKTKMIATRHIVLPYKTPTRPTQPFILSGWINE